MPRSQPKFSPTPRATIVQKRILVVDDDHAVADSLAFMLSHEGYSAKAAYSGQEAIELSKQLRPDLLIIDVVMPGLSGTEAAVQICKVLYNCHVILFSGQIKGKQLAEEARTGGSDFEVIEKPLHPQDLLAKIRGHLPRS
jgi:DNA-binding response OmpR family regulator